MDDFGNALTAALGTTESLNAHCAFVIDGLLFDQCYLHVFWAE